MPNTLIGRGRLRVPNWDSLNVCFSTSPGTKNIRYVLNWICRQNWLTAPFPSSVEETLTIQIFCQVFEPSFDFHNVPPWRTQNKNQRRLEKNSQVGSLFLWFLTEKDDSFKYSAFPGFFGRFSESQNHGVGRFLQNFWIFPKISQYIRNFHKL